LLVRGNGNLTLRESGSLSGQMVKKTIKYNLYYFLKSKIIQHNFNYVVCTHNALNNKCLNLIHY